MRIRISKCAVVSIVIANLTLFFVSWKFFIASEDSAGGNFIRGSLVAKPSTKPRDRVQEANIFLKRSVTIIFRDFYHFDNDLKTSIEHLINLVPGLRILIISDELPYPPMNIFTSSLPSNQSHPSSSLIFRDNVQFFNLEADLTKSASESNPLNFIITKYVFFMPDSFRLSNGRQLFQRLIKSLGQNIRERSHRKVLVVPFASNHKDINYCFQINTDVPNWTLEYEVKNTTKNCNLVSTTRRRGNNSLQHFPCFQFTQKHALLLETSLLNDFPEPFSSPFPEFFYLQAKFANCQVSIERLNKGFLPPESETQCAVHAE
jgi:fukutin-related protein